jgi:hypothetical protein
MSIETTPAGIASSPLSTNGSNGAHTQDLSSGRYTKEELADYLRTMVEIREFEVGLYNMYRAGKLKGATHMSAGQEAVPTGACAAITRRDTHRQHPRRPRPLHEGAAKRCSAPSAGDGGCQSG